MTLRGSQASIHEARTLADTASAAGITNTIRRLRFEHGEMTQAALARSVGVARQTIIALEAGRYAPSLALAFRIAAAFEVGLEAVFAYDGGRAGEASKWP